MRILWVEDLGDGDCPAPDLSEIYAWERESTYSKAKDAIKNHLDKYDVVLLDINLTGVETSSDSIGEHYLKDVPEQTDPPFNLEKDKFLREAGFHLYIQLLEMGFPKDRIAFLSANISNENEAGEGNQPNQTYDDFKNRFHAARIEAPEAFEKNKPDTNTTMKSNPFNRGEEKSELAKWLDECETDYIKLRRGIIDACDELSENLLHVNSSLCSSIGFREDIQDKLIELRTMLPVRDPGEKCKQLLLKRMARAIVHDWESYNPNNATFGFLLRTARNWLAHEKGKLTIKVEETDIAFLFILHIRSVFKSYSANYLRSIEMKLLLLFNSPNTQLDCQALNESVKLSYYTMHTMTEYIKTLDCYKCEYKGDSFFQLSSFCRMHLEHSHDLTKYKITEFSLGKKWLQNGMTLIYQGFFHAVCSPESNKLSHLPRDRYGVVNFTFNEPKKFMDVFINYAEFPKLEESDE